jgi:hypothetical protein
VGNRWNEGRFKKKGNMKLIRDAITGHQCWYEGQSYIMKEKNSVKKGKARPYEWTEWVNWGEIKSNC